MTSQHITDSFTNLLAGIVPGRSKAMSGSYTAPLVTDDQLINAYRSSGLIQRVVDIPAEDQTSAWRAWQAEDDQISAIEEVETRLDVLQKVRKSITRARKLGDGYIYMDNGEDPSEPLDVDRARPLRGIAALRPYMIVPGDISEDILSEWYDKPEWYEIAATDNVSQVRIHPSRIVHFVGKERDDVSSIGKNDSVITAMFSSMRGFDAVMSNIADMTYEAKIDVFGVAGLMTKVQDPEELKAITEKYRLTATQKGVNGMIIHDLEEESYQQKELSFATLPEIIDRFQQWASGDAMIPRSRLFGVQTGGLGNAGASDDRNYYDRIHAMQRNNLTPAMWRLDKMIIKTALGSVPDEVHYNWRPLVQMDQDQLAKMGVDITKKYVDAVNSGIFSAEFATEPLVNELTEAGISPGLESMFNKWIGEMQEGDLTDGDLDIEVAE